MTREAFDFIYDECRADAEYDRGREEEGVVGECDNCGGALHDYDEALAVMDADGKNVAVYCQYCTAKNLRFVEDVLESAGIWHMHGWADDVINNAQAELHERRKTGVPAKKRLVIRTAAEMYGQRAF